MWRLLIETYRRPAIPVLPCILAYSVILFGASPQSAAGENSAGSKPDDALEEVIVTAEKREATIQSTPISITAFRGADLRQAGVSDLQSVAEQVPGVSFKTGGPGQTELEMRGLNSGGGNSPTVGLYLDDIPLSSFAYATAGKVVIDPDLYDLERVEVLRGPQGTLYGAGSMGGAIRLITSQPDLDKFSAGGELVGSGTEGGGANGTFNGMLNLPIVDNELALRIVATQKYLSGWIDRIVPTAFPLPLDGGLTRGDVAAAPGANRDTNV
jgi:outer membrane receptor protein involved in Fe transport